MNVLIVTHNYAPDRAPRAFRWTAIAAYWAAQGAHVDVVTTGRSGLAQEEDVDGVHLHRVGERWFGRLRRGATGTASSNATQSRFAFIASIAKAIYDITWKRIYWPDHSALWYPSARNCVRRLCGKRSYDALITVSHPFSAHMVGLAARRQFPKLKWIVDVGDPFSLPGTVPFNNEALYRTLNRRAEARVYADCDMISVTVEGCRRGLRDAFPVSGDKTRVIPPLLSLSPREIIEPDKHTGRRLVYIGVLYGRIRRANGLLALFARLRERNPVLELHFYGELQDCESDFEPYARLMGVAIFVHGPVPRQKVPEIMANADILVNVGNDTSFQLPSKLVEYVSAEKPIINVAGKEQDTAAAFLTDYPAALTVICDPDAPSAEDVERCLRFIDMPPKIEPARIEAKLAKFKIDAVADAYKELIYAGSP